MTSRALREAFHREFMTFFERAERTRRWNVFTDIAWNRLAGSAQMADPRLVRCAETFCGVEMYLPDYLRAHLDLMRGDYGRAWFAANWGYEEAKHSLALREYLRRTGARDDGELHDYAETVLARSWRAPYGDGRRMTIYGAIQELTTFVIYRKQRRWAERLGDPVLPEIYRLIGRDEMAHARFYLRMVGLHWLMTRTAPAPTSRSCSAPSGCPQRTCCPTTRTESRSCAPPASTAGSSWPRSCCRCCER